MEQAKKRVTDEFRWNRKYSAKVGRLLLHLISIPEFHGPSFYYLCYTNKQTREGLGS